MQSKGILVNIDSEVYEIKSVTCENSKVTFWQITIPGTIGMWTVFVQPENMAKSCWQNLMNKQSIALEDLRLISGTTWEII